MNRSFRYVAAIACCMSVAACSAPPEGQQPPSSDAGTKAGAQVDPVVTVDAGPPDPCASTREKLQSALDATVIADRGALLAINTPACGTLVVASGASTPAAKVTTSDLFKIGSVTKTFVAAGVLKLVEQGKVSLEDPLSNWLPTIPNSGKITIRMLLSHRSGLYNYSNDQGLQFAIIVNPERTWAPMDLITIATSHPSAAPGAGYNYANTNYIALGLIIEAVTKTDIASFLRSELFEPQKLTSTFFDGSEKPPSNVAHGYVAGIDATTSCSPSSAWAAGAIGTSGVDMLQWVRALYGGHVLSSASLKEMLPANGASYGLGTARLNSSVLGEGFGHSGLTFGYVAEAWYFPKSDVAIASFVNDSSASPSTAAQGALAIIAGKSR